MKEKILAMLKTKYSNLGLGEKILERYAAKLAKTTKEEKDIETAVDGVEEDLQVIQSLNDSHRTELAKLKNQIKPESKGNSEEEKKPENEDPQNPDEKVPAWAKKMAEDNANLTKLVSSLSAERSLNSRKSKLEAELKNIKDLPDFYRDELLEACESRQFADDEAFNEFLTAKVTKAKEVAQSHVEKNIDGLGLPLSGSGKTGSTSQVDDAIKQWANTGKETKETN